MKENIKYLLMACIATAACDTTGWDYPLNEPRSQVLVPEHPEHYDRDTSVVSHPATKDTILFLCGVRIPDEYDWQRDTGIGIARGEVVLFKNMEEVLAMPTGYNECVSTDPDTHHLIDGDLYTEFSSSNKTYIKKNSYDLLSYDGREYMAGIVNRSGSYYTLGIYRSGNGLCMRRDGTIILDINGGIVLGSFSDPAYPQTGALYEDSGKLYFAYNIDKGGSRFSHIVIDGRDSTLTGGPYDDIRAIGGKLLAVRHSTEMGIYYFNGIDTKQVGTAYEWRNCFLFNAGGKAFVAGTAKKRSSLSEWFIVMDPESDAIVTYAADDYHLYADGENVGIAPAAYPGFHYFSKSCMDYLGGRLYVVLSPKHDDGKPVLRINGKDTELEMKGYLSGVQVRLSPPS